MTVWLAQCLCGSNRHAIAALAGEFDDELHARMTLLTSLGEAVAAILEHGVNPWCAICGADAKGWRHEFARTRFATMEEAEPELAKSQASNALANILFGTHGPDRPKRQ
jgi:hypothetical protein